MPRLLNEVHVPYFRIPVVVDKVKFLDKLYQRGYYVVVIMAKPLGHEIGLVKYIVKTPLTVVGFVSMYIFGGGILSFLSGLQHLFTSQNVFDAMMVYFTTKYLPPTSVSGVIIQALIGSVVAGLSWYWATAVASNSR